MTTATPPVPDLSMLVQLADSMSVSAQVLARMNQLMLSPMSTLVDIAQVLRTDPSLAARVVRIANSAFFATKTRASSLEEALQRVGLREVYRIVGTAALGRLTPVNLRAYGISGDTFLKAALFSATSSQLLAVRAGMDGSSAYLAGLMRPLGVLVLNHYGETHFNHVDELACDAAPSLESWERDHFGFNHSEVSAQIIDHWGFSEHLVHSVGAYSRRDDADPLSIVLHAAGALAVSSHATLHPRDHDIGLERNWLAKVGIPSSALPEISLKALRAARSIGAN
ncbi:HDOD domain-containing protein [Rariglobus hedericola]|uniref:HDOD domain-containing protein n=1 Tax=Rariglobus hedericola TaxID=2597822 RepID=A0A556QR41_9BACT|nr:HDOD domain-containing protein [Rariglobus hedericola]TSJ79108.1 HDOD domain-containing protein [Rariglobus hedericola]